MVGQGREPAVEAYHDGTAGDDQAKTWEDLKGDTLLEEAKALALYVGVTGTACLKRMRTAKARMIHAMRC